jgi:toxin ParE1/3/4
MRIAWTPDARQRLKEIEAYIAKQSSAQIAREVALRLIRRALTLEQPPLLGTRITGYGDSDLRQLFEKPYRIIYRVKSDQIEIITVLHYRQLLPSDMQD